MPFQPRLQAQDEFWRAHYIATVRSLLGGLARCPTRLRAFDESSGRGRPATTGPRTLQEVPLMRVVGSVGRAGDYTRNFLPRRAGDEARWVRVRLAVDAGGLPPLELYRLGEDLFVRDGHHRASVLRSLGIETVEAYVIDVRPQVHEGCSAGATS